MSVSFEFQGLLVLRVDDLKLIVNIGQEYQRHIFIYDFPKVRMTEALGDLGTRISRLSDESHVLLEVPPKICLLFEEDQELGEIRIREASPEAIDRVSKLFYADQQVQTAIEDATKKIVTVVDNIWETKYHLWELIDELRKFRWEGIVSDIEEILKEFFPDFDFLIKLPLKLNPQLRKDILVTFKNCKDKLESE